MRDHQLVCTGCDSLEFKLSVLIGYRKGDQRRVGRLQQAHRSPGHRLNRGRIDNPTPDGTIRFLGLKTKRDKN